MRGPRALVGAFVVASVLAICTALAAAPAALSGRCSPKSCYADVGVSGHAEPQPIHLGEVSQFKVTPQNNGLDGALDIEQQVVVPRGLKILGVRAYPSGRCSVKGTFVDCRLGDFADQQQAVVRVRVRGVKVGTWVANAHVYSTDVVDSNQGNNVVGMTLDVLSEEPSGGADGTYLLVSDGQRILHTGGVRTTVSAGVGGTVVVYAVVHTPNGPVRLAVVRTGLARGAKKTVFLGASRHALARIRAGLRVHQRLKVDLYGQSANGATARKHSYVVR